MGSLIGLAPAPASDAASIGVSLFWNSAYLWFYAYYLAATLIFAAFWFWFAPHRWQLWSILGTSLIIFATYFSVHVVSRSSLARAEIFAHQQIFLADSRVLLSPLEQGGGGVLWVGLSVTRKSEIKSSKLIP